MFSQDRVRKGEISMLSLGRVRRYDNYDDRPFVLCLEALNPMERSWYLAFETEQARAGAAGKIVDWIQGDPTSKMQILGPAGREGNAGMTRLDLNDFVE